MFWGFWSYKKEEVQLNKADELQRPDFTLYEIPPRFEIIVIKCYNSIFLWIFFFFFLRCKCSSFLHTNMISSDFILFLSSANIEVWCFSFFWPLEKKKTNLKTIGRETFEKSNQSTIILDLLWTLLPHTLPTPRRRRIYKL